MPVCILGLKIPCKPCRGELKRRRREGFKVNWSLESYFGETDKEVGTEKIYC